MYPQVFGKYVLERELSRGGMARVLLATLRGAGGFEKRLVVKQIRDELAYDNQFVRRFVEEAKTTVALSHPNIVPVYELGIEQGTYFLAMELVEGVSVAELLRERTVEGKKRVLSPEEGAYIGIEVCRALDYAHRRMKMVHRDITPRNVMIDEEGQVKLIDFGIAAPALVAGHEILGSPGHMPPEQVDGTQLGPETDIFALAVLLMEAWTGTPPFRRGTPEECDAAMREPHPKPSEFDKRLAPLDDTVSRALQLDPRARQQEVSELSRALRSFMKGVDTADISVALGARVTKLRFEQSEPEPASSTGEARAPQASHGDLGTKTFAARDEALQWSSRPPSNLVPPDAPSTRRLSGPVEEEPVPSTPHRPSVSRGRADDPAMAIPTPLMIDPDELAVIKERAAEHVAGKKSERPPAKTRTSGRPRTLRSEDHLETIATRPLETPVRPIEPISPARPAAQRGRGILYAAAVLLIAGLAIMVYRSRATSTDNGGSGGVTADAGAPATAKVIDAAPAPTITAPPPATSTPAIASTPGLVVPPPPSHTATGQVPPSAAAVAGKATVTLLGDGTHVSIDGVSRGGCPQRVMLEPGSHEARFTFDPTGESRGERFTVKAGERVIVRADFTGATPTIKIQR